MTSLTINIAIIWWRFHFPFKDMPVTTLHSIIVICHVNYKSKSRVTFYNSNLSVIQINIFHLEIREKKNALSLALQWSFHKPSTRSLKRNILPAENSSVKNNIHRLKISSLAKKLFSRRNF